MRRGIRALLIVVVILGGLFVAADRIAVSYAESKAADRIQTARGLSQKPEVSIKGFPFLTQVLSGDLDDVQITFNNVQAPSSAGSGGSGEPLHLARFTADLRDVRLDGSFPNFSGATAASATGTALVPYADISRMVSDQLTGTVSDVSIGYGGADSSGHGTVKVAGTVRVPLLGSQRLSAVSAVSVSGGDSIGISFPDGLSQLVGERTGLSWPVTGLPTGIRLNSVQATPDGLQVSLTGTGVAFAEYAQ